MRSWQLSVCSYLSSTGCQKLRCSCIIGLDDEVCSSDIHIYPGMVTHFSVSLFSFQCRLAELCLESWRLQSSIMWAYSFETIEKWPFNCIPHRTCPKNAIPVKHASYVEDTSWVRSEPCDICPFCWRSSRIPRSLWSQGIVSPKRSDLRVSIYLISWRFSGLWLFLNVLINLAVTSQRRSRLVTRSGG